MEDYRRIYVENTGIDIPDGYDIHHLDLNRNNNEILNLVALPRKLHQKFHEKWNELAQIREIGLKPSLPMYPNGLSNFDFWLSDYNEYSILRSEVIKWIVFRDFLMGNTFNYFNLSY